MAKYKEILKENELLKEENIKYERAVTRNIQLVQENLRLRNILGIREKQLRCNSS